MLLLCPTPKDPNPKPCLGEGAGSSGPHLFWVWRCCGCCWFGLPWTFRRTPPPPDRPPPDRPKFRSFFPLSRHNFALFVSLWESSRWILVVFLKARTLKCARLGSREFQTCTFEVPGASNTTKIPRTDTQTDTKRAKWWREREKKREILRPPTLRPPTLRGPTLRGHTFSRFGPHPSGPHFFKVGPAPFGATPLVVPPFGAKRVLVLPCFFVVLSFFEKQEKTETVKLAKVGLAKVGHPNFGQSRSIKVGQSRSNFFGQSRFGQSRIGQSRSQPLFLVHNCFSVHAAARRLEPKGQRKCRKSLSCRMRWRALSWTWMAKAFTGQKGKAPKRVEVVKRSESEWMRKEKKNLRCALLADADFGQTDFGHLYLTDFGPNLGGRLWPSRFWPKLVVSLLAFFFEKKREQQDEKKKEQHLSGPRRVRPGRVGEPRFSRFFSPPFCSFFFSLSLWWSSREMCAFEVPGLQKHKNSTTPREGRKEWKLWREREKSAKFWAVRERGGPSEGGPGEGLIFLKRRTNKKRKEEK